MAHSYPEYQIVWRFANDHTPDAWEPIGRPCQDRDVLIDILGPEDYHPGNTWQDDDKVYKVRERKVHVSDWHDERNPKQSS